MYSRADINSLTKRMREVTVAARLLQDANACIFSSCMSRAVPCGWYRRAYSGHLDVLVDQAITRAGAVTLFAVARVRRLARCARAGYRRPRWATWCVADIPAAFEYGSTWARRRGRIDGIVIASPCATCARCRVWMMRRPMRYHRWCAKKAGEEINLLSLLAARAGDG